MDPAFGPRALAALNSETSNVVYEVQQLLKQLGYDPGDLDGIMGPRTQSALTAYWMAAGGGEKRPALDAVLNKLRESAARAKAQVPSKPQAPGQLAPPSLVDSTQVPFWKKPGFIGIGIAVTAGLAWLAIRSEGTGAARPVGDAGEPKPKRRRVKPVSALLDESPVVESTAKEKCSRTPTVDFDSGEVLALPAETTTAPPL